MNLSIKKCEGCSIRCLCHKAKTNRKIEVNHRLRAYKQKARELLTSEEGLRMRSKRPIEPEAVFGIGNSINQTTLSPYWSRQKKMDFAIFAIAFNISKLFKKRLKKCFFLIKNRLTTLKKNLKIQSK